MPPSPDPAIGEDGTARLARIRTHKGYELVSRAMAQNSSISPRPSSIVPPGTGAATPPYGGSGCRPSMERSAAVQRRCLGGGVVSRCSSHEGQRGPGGVDIAHTSTR